LNGTLLPLAFNPALTGQAVVAPAVRQSGPVGGFEIGSNCQVELRSSTASDVHHEHGRRLKVPIPILEML